jgi:antitoxin YefM
MKTISASKARAALLDLIDDAAKNHTPIRMTGKRHDAVLISVADWESIQETLHLLAVPGMSESIHKGIETPLDQCDTEPRW